MIRVMILLMTMSADSRHGGGGDISVVFVLVCYRRTLKRKIFQGMKFYLRQSNAVVQTVHFLSSVELLRGSKCDGHSHFVETGLTALH